MNTGPISCPPVIQFLYEQLQIDAQWCERQPRGFAWWPYRLCQRVWAEEPKESEGFSVTCIRVQTDLLKQVPPTPEVYSLLTEWNGLSSLSAFTYEADTQKIVLTGCAYVHAQNYPWTSQFLKHMAVLQLSEAQLMQELALESTREAGISEAELAESAHPKNGFRPEPDEMTAILPNLYAPLGKGPSRFEKRDFLRVEHMKPTPSVMTTASDHGFSAEVPYAGEKGGGYFLLKGRKSSDRLETALFQASSREPHPYMGGGCLFLLTLPDRNFDAKLANELNMAESRHFVCAHGMGAWCADKRGLTHVAYFPSAMYMPGIMENMIWNAAMRARWARRFLS